MVHTISFSRRKLPHWQVEGGRYFVTVRCADSLPKEVVLRMAELHYSLVQIEPRSAEFAALQRHLFRILERYLDAGTGSCPLRNQHAAQIVVDELRSLEALGVGAPHFTIMPNHWHALLVPEAGNRITLAAVMRRVKGRSARAINALTERSGSFWQREWFDRWIRDDAEWERCVAYIRNNPVKAGLVHDWTQHPWTK